MNSKVAPMDVPPAYQPPAGGQPSGYTPQYGQPPAQPPMQYGQPGQPPMQYGQGQLPMQYGQSQPPMQYGQGQPPMQYGQPNVQVIQNNAGYQPQPMVVVQQAARDYTMSATAPGVFMIIAGFINLICFVVLIIFGDSNTEFIIAFLLYLIAGILACAGSCQRQQTGGVATGCLVIACFALCMSFEQIIGRAIGITLGEYMMVSSWMNRQLGAVVYYTSIFLEMIALISFALSITLIVLPSKVVCSCCRSADTGGGMVFQRAPLQNAQVITIA